MIAQLVPSNHMHIERALAEALGGIEALDPALIETLWDAWACPAPMLPFLAYALSVDLWEDAWSEIQKRQAIADSPAYHRRKGTRAAIEQAIRSMGREASLVEWWQFYPPQRRATFAISVDLDEAETQASIAPVLKRLSHLVRAAKPKSRAFSLSAAHHQAGEITVSVGLIAGSGVTLAVPNDDLIASILPYVSLRTGSVAPLEVS